MEAVGVELSIIVPAFNEEKNIVRTVRALGSWLKDMPGSHEIIIVDDGSTDRTAELVRSIAREYGVTLLHENTNHGKGYAVSKGMLAAHGQYMFFMDADLSYPVESVDRMLPHLQSGYDIVIGSRALHESRMVVRPPLRRYIAGRAYSLMIQAILLPGIPDTQCGLKGFTRVAARDLFPRLTLKGFAFDVELLYLTRQLGYRLKTVPVELTFVNSTSKVKIVSDSLKMLRDLFRIRFNYLRGAYGARQAGPETGS